LPSALAQGSESGIYSQQVCTCMAVTLGMWVTGMWVSDWLQFATRMAKDFQP